MKKIIFILIFSFNSYLNSLEGVDECSEFIKLVNSESEINYFSYPDEYELPRLFFKTNQHHMDMTLNRFIKEIKVTEYS